MKQYLFILVACVFSLCILIVYQISRQTSDFMVVFCDAGQGDAIYIKTPKGTDIVVDGGPDSSILSCLESNMPFWDRSIEIVFATHPDADHISGLVEVLKRYRVDSFNTITIEKSTGIYDELEAILAQKGVTKNTMTIHENIRTEDGVVIETLWPDRTFLAQTISDDANDASLVQLITYGEFRLLLTGDVSAPQLNPIMRRLTDVDVLKLPHHGSKTGIDSATFSLIRPQLAIVSAGRDNPHGHPHSVVLQELKKHNVRVLRTDKDGAIKIVTDGKTISVVN